MDHVIIPLGEPMKQDYDKKDIAASPETKVAKKHPFDSIVHNTLVAQR